MPSLSKPPHDVLRALRDDWNVRFGGGEAASFFAPGRVNLLGAHLDYNEGFVLPIAVDRGTYTLARARADRKIRLASVDREPEIEVSLDELAFDPSHGWANYPKGVLAPLARELPGLDLLFGGDLPIGAGLSSSASILVATATAANRFLAMPRSSAEIVRICHRAEVSFVGIRCGIMDPYASVFGMLDHVIHLDCRSIEHNYVPFDSSRAAIMVCDTTRRRELSDGRFNDRVRECAEALSVIRSAGVEARALRDVSKATLARLDGKLEPRLARRALHVAGEIERTEVGAAALRRGDFDAFGRCLRESHLSCRDLYEVSSPELDALVDAAHRVEGTYGARLTGAGFGGCCVALVRTDAVERFRERAPRDYQQSTGFECHVHVFRPSSGARPLAETQ